MLLNSLCAFFLALCVLSFWIVERRIITVGLYIVSLVLAFLTQRITLIGGGVLLAFLVGFILINRPNFSRFLRSLGYLILLAIGMALCMHIAPGFSRWELITGCKVSPSSAPYSLCFNFDKVSVGIFILLSTPHLISQTTGEWRRSLFCSAFFTSIAIAILLIVVWSTGIIRWEPKWPAFMPLWLVMNLLFFSVVDEAIFRGFIQDKLMRLFVSFKWGRMLALLCASVLFAILYAHLGVFYMVTAFIAGLIYGGAYIASRRLEASIITHFVINFVHLIGFTYPIFQAK